MANSFIRVPPGYEGPSDFHVAVQNKINKDALENMKVDFQNYDPNYRVELAGVSKTSANAARMYEPASSLLRRRSDNDDEYDDDSELEEDQAEVSKASTITAGMCEPASSLLKRQSDSDSEYDQDSELEGDLALMRVSLRRPAGQNLESNLEVKEALDVLEQINAEKALVENALPGKYPRLTLPTRNKTVPSDAKEKNIKVVGEGAETHTQAMPPSRVMLPPHAKQPTHVRVVIPITDEEAAEENSEQRPTEDLGGPVQSYIRILSHRSHDRSSYSNAPPPP